MATQAQDGSEAGRVAREAGCTVQAISSSCVTLPDWEERQAQYSYLPAIIRIPAIPTCRDVKWRRMERAESASAAGTPLAVARDRSCKGRALQR